MNELHRISQSDQKRWNECMNFISNSGLIKPEQFRAWFIPISFMSYTENRLDVRVPSGFFKDHLELNYKHILIPAIRKFFGDKVALFYNYLIVSNDESSSMSVKTDNPSLSVSGGDNRNLQQTPFDRKEASPLKKDIDSQLNPRYTFANYCVSSSNRLAKTIGEAIVNDPRCKTFNPLFIYGASGVGKTHLMQAIGIGLKERNPESRVLYVTARLFESQSVYALLHGKINDFLEFYQSVDCLLIDDIQDLISKDKTQNAFFHIFNYLHLNNKQIVLTSDCSPQNMQGMPERLLTRFKWGMTVELEKPDYELRKLILLQKSMIEGVKFPEEVVEYIARNARGSIRELEGIMVNLMARATFMGEIISIDSVKNILNDTIGETVSDIHFDSIVQCVSNYYHLDVDALFTKDRRREVSDARQMVMYLAKKHTDMKFQTIATRLARNHSTVMHACKNIDARLGIERQLRYDIEKLERELGVLI